MASTSPSEALSNAHQAQPAVAVETVEKIEPDRTLDLRGLWCPLPPLRTVAALKQMRPGEVLEVLGTNPVGNRVAPWVAQKLGDQLLGVIEDEGGFHRFFFRRSP